MPSCVGCGDEFEQGVKRHGEFVYRGNYCKECEEHRNS